MNQSATLITTGSHGSGFSEYYQQYYEFSVQIDRVVELAVGVSEYSLGLQIADFFATFAYQYYRAGRPKKCGWWKTLCASLRQQGGRYEGYGLKTFP